MTYNYCYIIIRNGKAVKEIYTNDLFEEDPIIRYKWTEKNYEALPFLKEPIDLPPHAEVVELALQTFFYIEREDGIPTLRESLLKPYNAPNEFETINAAKKYFKQDIADSINQKKELIKQLKSEIEKLEEEAKIINYLELETEE